MVMRLSLGARNTDIKDLCVIEMTSTLQSQGISDETLLQFQ